MLNGSIFKQLLVHQFKSYKRSAFWNRSIVINILLGILILYLIANLVILGIFIDKIFAKVYPNVDAVKIFTKFLFYFLLFDFVFRFFIQKIPIIEIEPYLHLPIKRSKIFRFILLKSSLSLFNYLPLIVLIPFAVKVIVPEYSISFAVIWLLIFYFLLLANNFFSFIIKKYFIQKPLRILVLVLLVIAILILDLKGIFPISKYFSEEVLKSLQYPFILLVPFLLLQTAYVSAYRLLKDDAYLENFKDTTQKRKFGSTDFSFLKKRGVVGALLNLETKLIWRNKRPRTILALGLFFIFYGFVFYSNPQYIHNYFFLIGIGIILSGIFMMNYGQFVFGWESSYFDRIYTINCSINMLFQEKYYLFSFSALTLFIVTLPYAFFNYKIAFVNFAALLFNAGCNTYLLLFLGSFNKKKITLTKGAMMNYEGTSYVQFLIFIPVLGVPFLIFSPFYFFNIPLIGIAVIALMGFVGILLKDPMLKFLSEHYIKTKYKILNGFRVG